MSVSSTTLTPEAMRDLTRISAQHRSNKARLRAQLRDGTLTLDQVLKTPPRELQDEMLVDLIRLLPGMGTVKTEMLGRRAVRDGINIVVPLNRASSRTRQWLEYRLRMTGGEGRKVQYFDGAGRP